MGRDTVNETESDDGMWGRNAMIVLGICLVFGGCCSNVIFLEFIVKLDPGAGNLITFSQFAFIASVSLLINLEFRDGCLRLAPRALPLRRYCEMVALFCFMSVINNQAMGYKIAVPLHITIRSGSLLANMLFNFTLRGKRYSWQQLVAVMLVTAGIVTATMASVQPKAEGVDEATAAADGLIVLTGVVMLVVALCVSSLLGIFQEVTFKQYGREHAVEGLLYNHLLSLPFFLLMSSNLQEHVTIFNESKPYDIGGGVSVPILWLFLIGNVVCQYVCARGVYILAGNAKSLTMTLVLTVRKFVSLVISVFYFANPFYTAHWVGTGCLVAGTFLYIFSPPAADPDADKTDDGTAAGDESSSKPKAE